MLVMRASDSSVMTQDARALPAPAAAPFTTGAIAGTMRGATTDTERRVRVYLPNVVNGPLQLHELMASRSGA